MLSMKIAKVAENLRTS